MGVIKGTWEMASSFGFIFCRKVGSFFKPLSNVIQAFSNLPFPRKLRRRFCPAQDAIWGQAVAVSTSVENTNICTELLSLWAYRHCLLSSTCSTYCSAELCEWGMPFISCIHRVWVAHINLIQDIKTQYYLQLSCWSIWTCSSGFSDVLAEILLQLYKSISALWQRQLWDSFRAVPLFQDTITWKVWGGRRECVVTSGHTM